MKINLNTKEGLSLCGSELVKGFYKIVKTLKWVAWSQGSLRVCKRSLAIMKGIRKNELYSLVGQTIVGGSTNVTITFGVATKL